jgi:hypothetical protein
LCLVDGALVEAGFVFASVVEEAEPSTVPRSIQVGDRLLGRDLKLRSLLDSLNLLVLVKFLQVDVEGNVDLLRCDLNLLDEVDHELDMAQKLVV